MGKVAEQARSAAGGGAAYQEGPRVMTEKEEDTEFWRICTNVTPMETTEACFLALINCCIPGLGTMVAACCTESGHIKKT